MDFHAVKLLYFQKNDGFQAYQVAISRGTDIRGGWYIRKMTQICNFEKMFNLHFLQFYMLCGNQILTIYQCYEKEECTMKKSCVHHLCVFYRPDIHKIMPFTDSKSLQISTCVLERTPEKCQVWVKIFIN